MQVVSCEFKLKNISVIFEELHNRLPNIVIACIYKIFLGEEIDDFDIEFPIIYKVVGTYLKSGQISHCNWCNISVSVKLISLV